MSDRDNGLNIVLAIFVIVVAVMIGVILRGFGT